MNFLRHQLPAYSPLSARAALAAFGTADSRAAVLESLRIKYGAPEVILTDSGTSALALALQAASARRPGFPCVLPAYGCYDLATAALAAGVRVVLYDLDPLTLTPDASSVARAMHGGAAALVVVHLYGIPVPMGDLQFAADQAQALLIEDAAQGAGGSWDGRPLGALGTLSVLSFGRGKGITGGGGGALVVRQTDALTSEFRRLMLPLPASSESAMFGIKVFAQWVLGRPGLYGVPAAIPGLHLGETFFHEPRSIRNITLAAARVLRETIRASEEEAVVRGMNADRLRSKLRLSRSIRLVEPAAGGTPGWLRLPVLIAGHLDARAKRLGIAKGYPSTLQALPELAAVRLPSSGMLGAEQIARELWTLPTHSLLADADIEGTLQWLQDSACLGRIRQNQFT